MEVGKRKTKVAGLEAIDMFTHIYNAASHVSPLFFTNYTRIDAPYQL
jgi:hypothetical protein